MQVYLLVHAYEVKLKSWQGNESPDPKTSLDEGRLPDLSLGGDDIQHEVKAAADKDERMDDQGVDTTNSVEEVERMEYEGIETATSIEEVEGMEDQWLKKGNGDISVEARPGVYWDVFRRQDVSKLIDYLQTNCKDLWKAESVVSLFT